MMFSAAFCISHRHRVPPVENKEPSLARRNIWTLEVGKKLVSNIHEAKIKSNQRHFYKTSKIAHIHHFFFFFNMFFWVAVPSNPQSQWCSHSVGFHLSTCRPHRSTRRPQPKHETRRPRGAGHPGMFETCRRERRVRMKTI